MFRERPFAVAQTAFRSRFTGATLISVIIRFIGATVKVDVRALSKEPNPCDDENF